jgi:hypothetical protein
VSEPQAVRDGACRWNGRRGDSSTRRMRPCRLIFARLAMVSSRRGETIHLDLSARCSVKPVRVIRGSLSIGLLEPL